MPHPSRVSIGEYLKAPAGITAQSLIVAGSGTDNQETSGAGVDRTGFDSAVIYVAAEAVLAASKTLTCKLTVQHSPDNSTWADAPAAQQPAGGANTTGLTLTDGGAGSTKEDVAALEISLLPLDR